MKFLAKTIVCALLATACTDGEDPYILGVSDQVAYVGSELLIPLRATHAFGRNVHFSFSGGGKGIQNDAVLEASGDASALFRWMPNRNDVGVWTLDFIASDGDRSTQQSVTIEVLPTEDGAPVFYRPAGTGTSLHLDNHPCLQFRVAVHDSDTIDPILSQRSVSEDLGEHPQAKLTKTGPGEALWRWCPKKDTVREVQRWVFVLTADDGKHTPVTRHVLVVVHPSRALELLPLGGWKLADVLPENQSGCSVMLGETLKVPRRGVLLLGRNASEEGFREFWAKTINRKLDFGKTATHYIDLRGRCELFDDARSRFMLFEPRGRLADGPTLPMEPFPEAESFQRVEPKIELAGDPENWLVAAASTATPGVKPELPVPHAHPYISELARLHDEDDKKFEFIEIALE